jgi:hypothetical protein
MINTLADFSSSSDARILTPEISLRTASGSMFPVIDDGQVISIQVNSLRFGF